ncbi:winged helix-turn-helix domain-containing protein [Enterococcus sp. BWB1-3]|uniref:winged helix-turn-helix domain-containing protein n=1 Tax=unclassified Enterococcus TaxID=2608891 RepID=UPI001923F7A6|nr:MULTISPECIES: winged helix-turn-helix domain-containing protein [unclassified Enterococcus]MBL1229915.1 winged helix-turn-helix domain-containing protein [Enterococcus sp. BWB1-3]MCB5951431.1 winged helix-turn-helix domain-containing protein [Enterococcus sp. BWT-B8]MCB5954990.1 winged helix-turn-helix domain-containing protein [Enterococcus sp. CWB-B31]
MYNIGVNQLSGDFEHTYIGTLEKSKCNVFQVDKENVEKLVSNLDGVILKEDDTQNMGVICGLIMKIKEKSNPLIWVFSDQPSATQKVLYLQLGADGTFSSESEPEEVNLIIENSLKRYQKLKKEEHSNDLEKIKGKSDSLVELIPHNVSVKMHPDAEEIPLTRLEFQLMKLLHKNQSKGVTYKEIYEVVWKIPYKDNKYRVANLVFHLRTKLENAGAEPTIIRTVRSKGYMLVV